MCPNRNNPLPTSQAIAVLAGMSFLLILFIGLQITWALRSEELKTNPTQSLPTMAISAPEAAKTISTPVPKHTETVDSVVQKAEFTAAQVIDRAISDEENPESEDDTEQDTQDRRQKRNTAATSHPRERIVWSPYNVGKW